jgi:hypothetical protein
MSVEVGKFGHVTVDGKIEYFKKVPSSSPFCHFCRQRVDVVTVLERTNSGNPLHICKVCLTKRLDGFDAINR